MIVPTVATALILVASKSDNIIASNYFFQKIGNWSYSIYLWHWPVVVSLHYVLKFENTKWKIAGIIISFIFGYLSFLFIETTSRRFIGKLNNVTQFVLFASMGLTVLTLSFAITNNNGYPERLPPKIEAIAGEKNNFNPRSECLGTRKPGDAGCIYGGSNIRLVVIGDSHANAVVQAVAKAIPNGHDGILELSTPACQFSKVAIQNRIVFPAALT